MAKPQGGWKLKRDSLSKLIVWFKDGNIHTFFSLDWKHRYSQNRDRNLGVERLEKLVFKYGNKAETAIIYEVSSGKIISKYFEGERVEIRDG